MIRTLAIALPLVLAFVACDDERASSATADEVALEESADMRSAGALPVDAPAEPGDEVEVAEVDIPDEGELEAGVAPGVITAEQTVAAAETAGGLTALPPNLAVSVIDGWIVRLEDVPTAQPIAAKLVDLRMQLLAQPIDGAAVGALLTELGTATRAFAADDPALGQLASALTNSADQLGAQ